MVEVINESHALIKSVGIDNLLSKRDLVLARMTQAIDTIIDAQAIAALADIKCPRVSIGHHGHDYVYENGRTRALDVLTRQLDTTAWTHLMDASGMRTLLDSVARKAWQERLYKFDVPAFTLGNVQETFSSMFEARGDMFDRGVVTCFRKLSWDYKTNEPCKFGKKIIMRLFQWNHAISDRCDSLDDLVRVFHCLDSKPEPDHRQGIGRQLHGEANRLMRLETDYLVIRWFANGNGHITFTRLDLIEKLNQIIAKHHPNALPPTRS